MNASTDQGKVLLFLAGGSAPEECCWYFRGIADHTELSLPKVKRACRALKTQGLAECKHGLFDDDGMVAGSGYCATIKGLEIAKSLNTETTP